MRLPMMAVLAPVSTGGLAQQPAAMVWRPAADSKIEVLADNMSVDDARSVASLSGHVQVTQGSVHLECSTAHIRYSPTGHGTQSQIDQVECKP
jgi:lipopolysaccharide export system protein LptA